MSQPNEPLTLATLEQASNDELLAFIKANSNAAILQTAMASRRKTIESGGDGGDNLSPEDVKKFRAGLLRKAAEIIHKMQTSPKKAQQNFSKTDYTVISVLNERQSKFLTERDANARRKDLFTGAAEDLQSFIDTTLKSLLTTSTSITTAEKAPMRMMMEPGLMAQIGAGKRLNKVRRDSESSLETASLAESTSASENESDLESDNESTSASMRTRLQATLAKGQKTTPLSKTVKAAQQIKQEKIEEINALLTEIRFLTGEPPAEIAALIEELRGIKKQVVEYKGQIDERLAEIELLQSAAKAKSTNLTVEEKIVAANFAKAVTAEDNAELSEEKRQEIISTVAKRIKVMGQKENTDLIMHLIKSLVVSELKTGPKSFEKGTVKHQQQSKEASQEAMLMKEMSEKLLIRSILSRYQGDTKFNAEVKKYLAKQEEDVTFEVAFADPEMRIEIVKIYKERMDEIARADEAEIAERLKREAELAAERARKVEAESRSLLESEGITFTTRGSITEFGHNLQAKLAQAVALARRDLAGIPDIVKGLDRAIAKAKADQPLHKVLAERRGSMVMSPDAAMVNGATAQGAKLTAEQKRTQEMESKLIASYQALLPFLQKYAEQLLLINEALKPKKQSPGAAQQKLNSEELGKIIKELKHKQAHDSRTMNKKEVESLITMTIKVVKISDKLKIQPKQSFILFRALSKVLDKVVAFAHNIQALFGRRKQAKVSRASLEELELAKQQVLNTVQNMRPTQDL